MLCCSIRAIFTKSILSKASVIKFDLQLGLHMTDCAHPGMAASNKHSAHFSSKLLLCMDPAEKAMHALEIEITLNLSLLGGNNSTISGKLSSGRAALQDRNPHGTGKLHACLAT